MSKPYLCPACRKNRKEFEIIYKLIQEVQKDERSGTIVFRGDELITPVSPKGHPDLDIRCGRCGYSGSETTFVKAAERQSL